MNVPEGKPTTSGRHLMHSPAEHIKTELIPVEWGHGKEPEPCPDGGSHKWEIDKCAPENWGAHVAWRCMKENCRARCVLLNFQRPDEESLDVT